MKKILSSLAIAILAVVMLTGCESHAYTISTNIFRVKNGRFTKDVTETLSIKQGRTVYVFACQDNDTRFTGGEYSYSLVSEDDGTIPDYVTADLGTYEGESCIVLNAEKSGSQDVTFNYKINGFHMYKTVTVKVK